jgi:adenosine deaminase
MKAIEYNGLRADKRISSEGKIRLASKSVVLFYNRQFTFIRRLIVKYKKMVVVMLTLLFGCAFVTSSHAKTAFMNEAEHFHVTAKLYKSIFEGDEPNIAKLNLFFTQMPKGGDLHHHYTGTIYAETYLEWVDKKGWYIDKCTFGIAKQKENEKCDITVQELLDNDALYRKLLTLWSDKDYGNHFHEQPPPDSNFFNTFGYFDDISDEYRDIGLKIIKQRALKENVIYIETMFTRTGVKSAHYFDSAQAKQLNQLLREAKSQQQVNQLLEKISDSLIGNEKFEASLNEYIRMVEKNHQGIDSHDFMMRYQTYAVRTYDPLQVFTDLLAGHLVVKRSPLMVGVNIVAPENNTVALADYSLHMRMFNYLSHQYPNVDRSLHAGELTLGMVRPKDLTFHIEEALYIARAQRIGHGVDLPYEQHSLKLLEDLKNNAAIEINLTSNEFILGVKDSEHPYEIYSSYGVPLVISTDDSGVSRNNLSHEYMLLATRYQPSYKRIKEYVYNSIEYSFLPLEEKARLKKQLDHKFAVFERKMANLYKKLK